MNINFLNEWNDVYHFMSIGLMFLTSILFFFINKQKCYRIDLIIILIFSLLLELVPIAFRVWHINILSNLWSYEPNRLGEFSCILYHVLTLMVVVFLDDSNCSSRGVASILWLLAAVVLCYSTKTLELMVLGWVLALLPSIFNVFNFSRFYKRMLWISLIGMVVFYFAVKYFDMNHQLSWFIFIPLTLAIMVRKGIFPFHSVLLSGFEQKSFLFEILAFNSHLGGYMLMKLESDGVTNQLQTSLAFFSIMALISALITSFQAIAEVKPRRILGLVFLSQSSFILAGFSSNNAEGIMGALLHWFVVSIASVGLTCIFILLERKQEEAKMNGIEGLGFVHHSPYLAFYFILFSLTLVGMPGSLGYIAEDMLYQGSLVSHPFLGMALIFSTVLNAIHLLRLHGIIFMGKLERDSIQTINVTLSQFMFLMAGSVFLIYFGLFPQRLIHSKKAIVHQLMEKQINSNH
jgi:NADH-quinone oxidoreductase subunit M